LRLKNRGLHLPSVDCGVKIVDEGGLALNSAVGQLTNLFRVKSLPGLAVKVVVKSHYKEWINHVDERIANVATVFEVDRQIKKVVSIRVVLVNPFKQHLLGVLVRDVLYHHGCPEILAVENGPQVKLEGLLPIRFEVSTALYRCEVKWHGL